MSKLTAKLLAYFGIASVLCASIILYRVYLTTERHVREIVENQAAMALSFDLAIRNYISDNVRPVMQNLLGLQAFDVQTMSTSYVARSIFEEVRKDFPDYIIKFSSDNPRNPTNLAGSEERKIIEMFNNHPELDRWQGMITVDTKRYLAKFSARRMKTSCLLCHGDPKDAPLSMLERYGATAGFYRPLGKVIGMDMVAIPITRISEKIKAASWSTLLISGLGLFCFFLLLGLVIKGTIINRLTGIAIHFKRAAIQDDYALSQPIELKGNDEISDLANSFNLLSEKLRRYYASLDESVKERTQELKVKNSALEQEICERRQAEAALKESEATLKSIFLTAPTGIGLVVNQLLIQANARLCEMVGYSVEEMIGENSVRIYADIAEYERVNHQMYFRLDHSDTTNVETSWKRKDGTLIHVSLCSRPIDPGNHAKGFIFTALDITAHKLAEEEKRTLEERLARSQKMEALGLLAGGVAHDLNNVLSGIVSYPDLILMELASSSSLVKPIQTIKNSGLKAAAIVQDLLTLARRGVTQTQVLNLNQIVNEYFTSPEYQKMLAYHPNLKVFIHCDPDLRNMRGSSVHLKKTVMNLISNASEAMPDGGLLAVSTDMEYRDRPIQGYDRIVPGDYCVLRVQDSGIGIDAQDLNRIFEPFYTKKKMGRSGTGLGMSVVWGTVQDHNGYILVQSTKGQGTLFALYFPGTNEPLAQTPDEILLAEYWGHGESILVVDDMSEQREMASAILTKLGYQVETAASGEEAVEKIQYESKDLIILDMIMEPGIDGFETYRRIRRIRPDQKVLIASGFSENERVKGAQQLGAGHYVKKPYTVESIAIAVKAELSQQV